MLFSIDEFFVQKNRAERFDCGVSNDRSKVTHLLVCIVQTQCFCFASSVCFGPFKNLILSSFIRDWCCFPSRRLLYTSICLSEQFCFLAFANISASGLSIYFKFLAATKTNRMRIYRWGKIKIAIVEKQAFSFMCPTECFF